MGRGGFRVPEYLIDKNKRLSKYRSKASSGADLGDPFPLPLPTHRDDLQFSNTAGILQNMQICMICIFSRSHYVIAQSKAFFVLTFKIKVSSQSHHSLDVYPPPKKHSESTPVASWLTHWQKQRLTK